ncbi:helix-turn-helix transcriptional regulator [Actinomyces ruminicola]|uniref:helix-turn-helix domain-containing protein n=1 Tax=Actinomyces ruminicola TaxID=332524 RepID=UPI0011C8D09B|nr:helix-turn-helix transcriptional regulator [Actinomyces ruminicola]
MQTTWNEAAATGLHQEMRRQHLTFRALAAKAKLEPSNVYRKITGKRALSVDEFTALSQALGYEPAEMLARVSANNDISSVDVDGAPAAEARGIAAVEHVGAALAGVPAEDLLAHEQACDSCWSLDDAARHLSGDEDPATHRSSDEEVA